MHPLNQIKLMKSFTRLAKSNVKLVMASHSNYIFNELNNRVLAGELGKSTYSPILMKCENEESNTYYMDMDEFGVSDSNFADASEILCDEREELIIKLMEKMEKDIKLYLVTSAYGKALGQENFQKFVELLRKTNQKDTLTNDLSLSSKLFKFQKRILKIEREIPPNPVIRRIT